MTKKETFINEVENAFKNIPTFTLSDDALTFFESLKITQDKESPAFTENGALILKFMQDNKDSYKNLFQAKTIGEGINKNSRTVSGAIRKLFSDGYVEKLGENPTSYALTQKGIEANTDVE